MCGRFTLRTPLTVLAKQFQFDLDAALVDVGPRYNIAPTQTVFAVRQIELRSQARASPILLGSDSVMGQGQQRGLRLYQCTFRHRSNQANVSLSIQETS